MSLLPAEAASGLQGGIGKPTELLSKAIFPESFLVLAGILLCCIYVVRGPEALKPSKPDPILERLWAMDASQETLRRECQAQLQESQTKLEEFERSAEVRFTAFSDTIAMCPTYLGPSGMTCPPTSSTKPSES